MDFEKVTLDDIRAYDVGKSVEAEKEVRKELALMRMDVYQDRARMVGKKKKLKKLLARVLTLRPKTSAE